MDLVQFMSGQQAIVILHPFIACPKMSEYTYAHARTPTYCTYTQAQIHSVSLSMSLDAAPSPGTVDFDQTNNSIPEPEVI